MANKLKQITTKAKALYKTGKFAKWTDAIKAASKMTTGKTAKKVGNVTLKKANYHKNDERYVIMNDGQPHLEGKAFFKNDALFVADALRKVKKKRKAAKSKLGAVKKAAPKKKAAAKSYHKDTKSHNVRISVMSGASQKATLMHLIREKEITENKLPTIKMLLKQETDAERKKHYKFWANRYTKYLTGLKKQISEAKKHI